MSSKKLVFSSKPYIIKNKGFSTIEFILMYPCKYNKNDMYYYTLLKQMLLTTSKQYPTEKEYNKAYNEKFIISSMLFNNIFNENLYFEFRLIVPDPQKIKKFDLESAFKFFIDTIYNPNVINEEFNIECFNREKRYIETDIKNFQKNVNQKAYQAFLNVVDDVGILKDNIYNNINLLDKVNSKDLYNVYKKSIIDNKPIIMVYGDIHKSINKLIKKYIKIEDEKIIIEKNYSNYLTPFKKLKEVEEKSEDNQSILYIAYKIKNMCEKDELFLGIIKNILGTGSNDLIFKELRLNKQLIYSSRTWMRKRSGLLVIESSINNNSKQKVINSVKKVMKKLKDKTLLQTYLGKIISDLEFELIRSKDNRVKKLNDFINDKFEFSYSLENIIEKYKNIDIDELLNFIDRLVLDTVYFSRGEFNE